MCVLLDADVLMFYFDRCMVPARAVALLASDESKFWSSPPHGAGTGAGGPRGGVMNLGVRVLGCVWWSAAARTFFMR